MPNSFVVSPDGLLLIASGFDEVLRWNGFSPKAEPAGVPAPTSGALVLAGVGAGGILGVYTAYARFLDADGKPSNPTPVSASFEAKGLTGKVTGATNAVPIVITSKNHNLHSGAFVAISGVVGNTAANGRWTITRIDADRFSLSLTTAGNGTYKSGGTWTAGVLKIVYTNVPVPDSPRIVRRQILRNTNGQAITYYVDVDTTDLSSTTLTSILIDQVLLTKVAVPVLTTDGQDLLHLYGIPPNDRCYFSYHLGRIFAAGTVEYAEGNVEVSFGSKAVGGIGTEWTSAAKGRFLYVVDGDRAYEVVAVDVTNQVLTLTEEYTGQTDPYAAYSLRTSPGSERLVYYTEAGQPEAWPAVNAFPVPEDGDQVTGLMTKGSFLYILERRHIYRFTYERDPALDGFVFLAARRGCVNQNCVVLVEDTAYMLDEDGVHAFDSRRPSPKNNGNTISDAVQTFFRASGFRRLINWSASRYFHGVHDPARETVKWFIALAGQYLPRHALCYAYQLDRWWIEEYPCVIGSSTLGKLARTASSVTWGVGRDQVFLGSDSRRVLAPGASTLDGVDPAAAPNRGRVVAAGRDSITLDAAPSPGLLGNPIVIESGRGRGQLRVVCGVEGPVIRVTRPWSARPDATSTWVAGGIPWEWKSGWFSWTEEEQSNERRVEVLFEPTEGPANLILRRYRNRIPDAIKMAASRFGDGVTTTEGDTDVKLDISLPDAYGGSCDLRIEGSKELYAAGEDLVSLGLSGVAGPEPVLIYQVNLDGAEANNSGGR